LNERHETDRQIAAFLNAPTLEQGNNNAPGSTDVANLSYLENAVKPGCRYVYMCTKDVSMEVNVLQQVTS